MAAMVAYAVLATLVMAPLSTAQAEKNFWEDSGSKPSVTGSRAKAAAKAVRGNKKSYSEDENAPVRKATKRRTRVASLGDDNYEPRASRKSLSGGGHVTWAASSRCLNGTLVNIVHEVASSYGGVTVSSTCRNHGHNRSVGGAPRSQHLTGDAVDFRVHGNVSGAIAFLRHNGSVGGFHHYGGGLFHIDTGPKRTW